jgi:hypothetical protein
MIRCLRVPSHPEKAKGSFLGRFKKTSGWMAAMAAKLRAHAFQRKERK